jgi:endo-1,4-beta-mannosidase
VWTAFDRAVWEREVAWSKRFGTNMLRIWLDWHAFVAIGDAFLDRFEEALEVLDANDIAMMPVLFNRWNDTRLPMGMVADRDLTSGDWGFSKFEPYVTALLERFGEDQRIVAWDLCNEPQAPYLGADINQRELVWLSRVADWVRPGSDAAVTIGTMSEDNIRVYAPLVDVISFHPYTMRAGEMDQVCQRHLEIAAEYDKPLVCTEACKGSLDDHERGAQAKDDVEALERHGIGWLLWQLVEGRFITGSRERTDDNALHPRQGYMPFILADGTTRPGHEWLEVPGIP